MMKILKKNETSANVAYARYERHKFDLPQGKLNGANSETCSSGFASEVSSMSASLISNHEGREYQRIEYTPYGETWVEMIAPNGFANLPYKFTGKERDEETGLYYYGARYLDPKYSRWISTDPALNDYVSDTSSGEGGVYNYVNLNLYHYGGNNPIKYTDPDGKSILSDAVRERMAVWKHDHYNRNDFQSQHSYPTVEDAKKAGFTQLGTLTREKPERLDACHENGIGSPDPKGNDKYTMSNGKGGSFELVYDSNGNLVTDEVNKGTYNFADPKGLKGKIMHGAKDVLPYLILGNSEDDPTTMLERITGMSERIPGSYKGNVNDTKEDRASREEMKNRERTRERIQKALECPEY